MNAESKAVMGYDIIKRDTLKAGDVIEFRGERPNKGTLVINGLELHPPIDPYLFLGDVKLHLANKVMEAGDVQAWHICEDAQQALDENTRNVMRRLDAYHEWRGGCEREDFDA